MDLLNYLVGYATVLSIEAIRAVVRLRVIVAIFDTLASLKILSLVVQAFYVRFFNRFILRIDNDFKPSRPDQNFLFEGFFPFCYFFYYKAFLPSACFLCLTT